MDFYEFIFHELKSNLEKLYGLLQLKKTQLISYEYKK